MNCQRFQDELFEYVEGTLSLDALAAAQRHLAECDACRQAAEKERRFASALFGRLVQRSQTLKLRLEIRRNILEACRPKDSAPRVAGSLVDLCKYWLRIAVVPAAMLLVAGVLVAIHSSGTRNHKIVSIPVPPRVLAVTPSTAGNPQASISIQMSYRAPRRVFHRKGNLVIDTLVDETVVVDETIPSGSLKNLPEKLKNKTPL